MRVIVSMSATEREVDMEKKTATIRCEGEEVTVEAGTPFTIVTKIAREKGLGKIIIKLDGKELVNESDDPEVIPAGAVVSVERDDGSATN